MQISYNWLKEFIKIETSPEETAEILTDLGLEVEGINRFETVKGGLEGIIVGHVLSCEKHPNADKLSLTKVDLGDGNEPVQVVCGAPNVAAGQKVLVATIGTTLYTDNDESFKIKKGKIRGEESFGMICAEDELGLGKSHDGIMVLADDAVPGTPAAKLFDIESDQILEIGLTPNRADAMSHFGVARDLRAGILQRFPDYPHSEIITPSTFKFKVEQRTLKYDIVVDDAAQTPRYCGLTISGVEVKDSPKWLQNRLKSIGLTPKNNIVDATNYVLHELGQPLHAFDSDRIKGSKIYVKNVEEGTKFVTLDGEERVLSSDDIMICDDYGPMCIAGIMGGDNSAVTEKTTSIFLESAYFNPVSIRKTAKRLGLSTDASFRYERGIDPNLTEYVLKRAALLIQDLAGGEITSDVIDIYAKKIEDFSVFLTFENVFKIIGAKISKETIKRILASLDIKINSVSDLGLGLTIPAYKVDVQREIDVVEEILRVYGFNNIAIPSKLKATIANSSRTESFKVENIITNQLIGQGFNEIMNNSLTTPKYSELAQDFDTEKQVHILNALSKDLSIMRQSLLFGGLETISYNINRKNSDLKMFESGKTYECIDQSTYNEWKHLSLFATGNNHPVSWNSPENPIDFYQFKGYVDAIFDRLGIHKFEVRPNDEDIFAESVAYYLGKNKIASFGMIKKNITKAFDIKQDVFFADIFWDNVLPVLSEKIKYKEIVKYPTVKRDLALLIDKQVSFDQLYKTVKKTDKNRIKEIALFDVYEGKRLPENKKSYAISLTIQDNDKTLTDSEIEKIVEQVIKNLEQDVQAQLR